MSETTTDAGLASRRAMLAGAAGVGAAAALAACGDNSPSSGNPGGSSGGSSGGNTGDEAGGSIAKKSDIPEGGGKIFPQERVVITQPSAGTFKAFDATCQHQFCLVTSVQGGTINCDCHGSKYAIADGSVKAGPTTKPLIPKTVTVEGDNLKVS